VAEEKLETGGLCGCMFFVIYDTGKCVCYWKEICIGGLVFMWMRSRVYVCGLPGK
jgi:hypothetical protein